MKKLFLIVWLLFLIFALGAQSCFAAGSCTTTEIRSETTGALLGYQFAWTSDASGDVSSVGAISPACGPIIGVQFVPGAGVSDLYDVTILDGNSVDVLIAVGADLSNTASATSNYKTPLTAEGGYVNLGNATLTPVVANAGNAKTGTIYLYLIPK
jgi:hypothetical protein